MQGDWCIDWFECGVDYFICFGVFVVWCGQVVDDLVDLVQVLLDQFDDFGFDFVGECIVVDVFGVQIGLFGIFVECG